MRYCIVAGTDSYLTAGTLSGLEENQRLLTDSNSDGFIPGEAAAAVRLALKANAPTAPVTITGIGFGSEKATIVSEEPLRADGMVAAIKSALAMAGCDMGALDFRICDLSGEQYGFKEAALALTRLLRVRKEEFDIWHPAECIGETGAAIVPVVLCVAAAALKKATPKETVFSAILQTMPPNGPPSSSTGAERNGLMGNNVFANGREISCKAADGKALAAFPDVCFTPPQTPATPPGVPIPYPNNAFASDATKGSKKVKISGKEVMLKNKSYFKTSSGDEAGSAPKKGVVTSKTKGKAFFTVWSMDVKVEGQNVVRHLDLTTHNHGSFPSNTTPWPYADSMAFAAGGPCAGISQDFKLVPYKSKDESGEKTLSCGRKSPPMTGHHLIPGRCLRTRTTAGGNPAYAKGCSHDNAPCVCVNNENQYDGTHRDCHSVFDPIEYGEAQKSPKGKMTYKKARDAAAKSAAGVNGGKEPTQKQQDCIKAQLDNYYKNCLKNKDGSISQNAQLNAQEDRAGLVLDKLDSAGNVGF
ncbi:PAAR-like domain-containing protein [Desulfosarcina cetonica]|uniref:PAAR-like domain-containing protein n=1 Tax=Desulfosarcina cetonica TaxID=90730 RepID=UPI001C45AC26|nr:PAAR-like domain-containing protein [Desulfosarcina cetonica]